MSTLNRRSCRRCGWSGSYPTTKKADWAKRVHGCQRRIDRAAAAERGRLRKAAVDRTPRPCLHKNTSHVHGTRTCYILDRCRCLPCSTANAAAELQRNRQKAYGRYDKYVDADPVRAHVRALSARGMGWKRVAEVAGISNGAMWKLLYGRRRPDGALHLTRRMVRAHGERILAVQLDLAPHAVIPGDQAIGTHRRLQSLVALGWSQSKLGERLGIEPHNMTRVVASGFGVQARTARAVAALYEELSMTLPSAETHREKISVARSRRMARERGWLPPLALDDDRLDDVDYNPLAETHQADAGVDEAAILRRAAGDRGVRLSRVERLELVRRLNAAGLNDHQICDRTGIHKDQVQRDRDRMGIAAHGRWAS